MEQKKSSKGKVFLIVILVLALLGTSGYIVYDKFIYQEPKKEVDDNKDKKNDKRDEVEVLEVSGPEVQDSYEKMSSAWGRYCGVYEYYTDKKVVATDISNDLAFDIAASQINENKKSQGIENAFFEVGDAFTGAEIEAKIVGTFGKNYSFAHKTYKAYQSCPVFEYDVANKKYVINAKPECGGLCGFTNLKRVVKAIKKDKEIEVYVRVLFAGRAYEPDYYKDYNKTQKVDGLDRDQNTNHPTDSDRNVAKGSLYKMIFTKEDGSYVFTSSELVTD